MTMIGSNHSLNGTDGGILLGTLAGVAALMLLLLLYIKSKKWWWSSVGTISCCEEACPPVSSRSVPLPPVPVSTQENRIQKHRVVNSYTIEARDSSSESEGDNNKTSADAVLQVETTASCYTNKPIHDLMSLVEKGRIGVSSNSSCCSSTTSSVGEKHGIPATKTAGHFNDSNQSTNQHHLKTNAEVEPHINNQIRENASASNQTDMNCNRDCIVMMNIESEEKHDIISCVGSEVDHAENRCCHLQVTLSYDAPMRKMTIHVLQAREIPVREHGQPIHTQVRLVLLPNKKQKYKTKIRSGENPQFMESFLLHRVNPEDVNSMGVRLRLYSCERMRKEKLLGECVVSFANLNLELENNFWLNLEPRANNTLSVCSGDIMSLSRSDSMGSTYSVQHGGVPELLLGLCYNATTGRLTIEVVKGSHFRDLETSRAPDTYVKLNLVSSTGQELAHSKTTVRRGQPNPLFKETFVFQVALFQLADVTLLVSVYNRKGVTKKKEMVGWFSLGLNSSGAEELSHWMDMKEFQQEQICRWHILVQS